MSGTGDDAGLHAENFLKFINRMSSVSHEAKLGVRFPLKSVSHRSTMPSFVQFLLSKKSCATCSTFVSSI